MNKLELKDLWSLEDYAKQRPKFRAEVLAHKRLRTLHLGPNMTLLFEDRMLVKYQVQEMLRVERIFEQPAIQEELDAYNPLIPDGSNWKVTCLIEFPEAKERRRMLGVLRGIEDAIWVRIGKGAEITAIADEDLKRSDEEKTSAVHFLRFELSPEAITALGHGATVTFGVNHPRYRHELEIGPELLKSLLTDLDAQPEV